MMLLAQFVVILLRLSFTALPHRSFVRFEEPFAQFHLESSKLENKDVFHFQGNTTSEGGEKVTKKAKPTQGAAGTWWNHSSWECSESTWVWHLGIGSVVSTGVLG